MRWEGSKTFASAQRLADAILARQIPTPSTPEGEMVALGLSRTMRDARPIVCPPEQLMAIPDEIFADLGEAFDFARSTPLPFPATFIDFVGLFNESPLVDFGITSVPMEFELRGVACVEMPDPDQVAFFPVVGSPGEPPEELGFVFLARDDFDGEEEPRRWIETTPLAGGRSGDVTYFSPSVAMRELGESPRGVQGLVVGAARSGVDPEKREGLKMSLAVATCVAARNAIKVLYLLDSENVELAPLSVSRQVRRKTEREGGEIAWTVLVRGPSTKPSVETDAEKTPGGSDYSHRFEVRGNFAHYGPETKLYARSAPDKLRPCARCGTCRRIWRPPHVKGPTDKPLVIKVRRVDDPQADSRLPANTE